MTNPNPEFNMPDTRLSAGEAFDRLDDAGAVDAVGDVLKETYTPTLKRIGSNAGEWGKGVYNKIFHKNKANSTENPVKQPKVPPVPSPVIPNTKESLVLSDSTDPKYNVSTPISQAIQPEATDNWGKVKADVRGTTLNTSIAKGNNRYSVFGDPMSQKVGASWQNGNDRVQLSHNISSGKNELSYTTSTYSQNFNASVWQQGSGYGANANYNQQINRRTQIGANASVSKTSDEGVKAAASIMYTKKGPRKNVALGAIASYEKGQTFMGVTGRITF